MRPPAVVAGLAALVVTAAVATSVLGTGASGLGGLFPGGASQDIALPAPDAPLLELRDRDPDQAAQLRASVDPSRPRCEPVGCEVWRYDTVSSQHSHVVVSEGRLAFIESGSLVVLDAHTGAVELRTDVEELERLTGDGDTIESGLSSSAWAQAMRGGAVVFDRGAAHGIGLDGTLRWTSPWAMDQTIPFGWSVAGNPIAYSFDRLVLLDADDGRVLYDDAAAPVWIDDDRLLVMPTDSETGPTGQVLSVDGATGEVLWATDPQQTPSGWPEQLGDTLLLRDTSDFEHSGAWEEDAEAQDETREETQEDGAQQDPEQQDGAEPDPEQQDGAEQDPEQQDGAQQDPEQEDGATTPDQRSSSPTSVVLDAETGEVRVALDAFVLGGAEAPDGTVVLLATTADSHDELAAQWSGSSGHRSADLTLLLTAFAPDGTPLWEHPVLVTTSGGCCADLTRDGDQIRFSDGRSDAGYVVDPATGALLEVLAPPSDASSWYDPYLDLFVTYGYDRGRLRRGDDALTLLGTDAWPVSGDPIVVVGNGQLVGMRLVPGAALDDSDAADADAGDG